MAGWRELIDPKEEKQTRSTLTFTRRFFESPHVSTCYPQMYQGHPDSCDSKVDGITITALNKSNLINQALVTYSPVNDEEQQQPGTSFNDLPLTMNTGGEIFTQETEGSDYYWLGNPASTRAHTDVQRRIATGGIEITEIIDSSLLDIDSSSGAFQRSLRQAGKINNATFRGLGVCNWLYDGASIERLRNSSGALQFKMIHGFSYRLPDFPAQDVQGWRLLWREESQTWDQITDTPGGTLSNPIPYTSGSFDTIFTTSGVN